MATEALVHALEDVATRLRVGWHGKPPPEQADPAIRELESRRHHVPPPPIRRPTTEAVRWPTSTVSDRGPAPAAATIATREAYGNALVRIGAADLRIVALDGDVKNSTYAERFRDAYPGRFFEAWIAEQNMVSMAAGLAAQGLIPFASSFACFLERAADQIRMAGISRSNVKLCGSHAGVSIGEDGPSQMGLEDLALFRAVPEAVVLYPSDGIATDACVQLAASHHGLVYLRTTRMAPPTVYGPAPARRLRSAASRWFAGARATALTIVAAGITLLLEAVGDSGVRAHRLAVREIPRSGPPKKLLERYGIGRAAIVQAVRTIVAEATPGRAAAAWAGGPHCR